jgi:hypothetical protein
MRITPELVPHRDFHRGRWLSRVHHPAWYYFVKERKARTPHVVQDPSFMASVDPPLREIVRFLHGHGIGTTPSCSGHDLPDEELEAIHASLSRDRKAIRNNGLELLDVETGEHHVFRNAHYRLPWSADEFVQRMRAYQQRGVLGMQLSARTATGRRILHLQVKGLRVEAQDDMLFLFTAERDEAGIERTWARITQAVKAAFHRGQGRSVWKGVPRNVHASPRRSRDMSHTSSKAKRTAARHRS